METSVKGDSCRVQLSHLTSAACPGAQKLAYLMCPPDHFEVMYEINPWMDRAVQPDRDLARKQWDILVSNLKETGATIEVLRPMPAFPDNVFTADIGLIDRHRFIMSHFRHLQRRPEVQHGAHWFQCRNYEVVELPLDAEASLESSDICRFRGYILAGYGFRTTLSAHRVLAHVSQYRVASIRFVDPRLYHLDMSFCPLDEHRAIVAPSAWSRRSCELVEKLVPEPLVLELDEALTFCANSIVIGKTVIMPSCPLRVGRILEQWGFTVRVSPVSEFLKAGGAVHCLALALHGPSLTAG